MKPICFFDLETTGTDKMNDRIVEIAIVKWNGDIIDQYYSLVNPGRPIPAEASDVHGITNEKVADAPTLGQIAENILEFIHGCDLGGFNSNSFDIPLLYIDLHRTCHKLNLDGINFIDVCNIFKRKEERTLSAAVQFYTGSLHDNAHNALDDVHATIKVFKAQLDWYADLEEKSRTDLSLYCNYDKPRCDLAGNFQIDNDGDYIFTFGKHKGQKAKHQPDYLLWMFRQDFLPDTKSIIQSILKF